MSYIYVSPVVTVPVDWGTTGEKTLLQIDDKLPAGRKVVIFALGWDAATTVGAQGRLRIKKGTTIMVEEGITHIFNSGGAKAKHSMLFAYDTNASANERYTFVANVTTAATGTSFLHVQGMVILLSVDAFFATGLNTNIPGGATVDIATINTTFPAGSKVVVLSYVQFGLAAIAAQRIYAPGAVRITENGVIVSSTQFGVGSCGNADPAQPSLSYFNGNTTANPSYSAQVYNSLANTSQAWAEIIAFPVVNGAFLDTGSVALTSGVQVTVGNLTTTLSGEVGVIALAAAENTGGSTVTGFNAGDVVLQINNSAITQIANQRGWYMEATGFHGRSGVYPLFRAFVNVLNPSYQVKMTARAGGINGEAKILAFKPGPKYGGVLKTKSVLRGDC